MLEFSTVTRNRQTSGPNKFRLNRPLSRHQLQWEKEKEKKSDEENKQPHSLVGRWHRQLGSTAGASRTSVRTNSSSGSEGMNPYVRITPSVSRRVTGRRDDPRQSQGTLHRSERKKKSEKRPKMGRKETSLMAVDVVLPRERRCCEQRDKPRPQTTERPTDWPIQGATTRKTTRLHLPSTS